MFMTRRTLFGTILGALGLSVIAKATPRITYDRSIQATIDSARDGDRVRIPPGTYRLDRPLRIDGRNGLTLDGSGCEVRLVTTPVVPWIDFTGSKSCVVTGFYVTSFYVTSSAG
jgi:hypothetical protein